MKVTRLQIQAVRVPLAKPIPSARIVINSADALLVSLHSDSGVVGEGMVFTLNGHRLPMLRDMILSLEPLVVGCDPGMSGAVWSRAWADVAFLGHRGISVVALSAIDMALWDLRGKAAGMNVGRLLGASREAVPIYRSGGLRLSQSIEELQAEAEGFMSAGFRAMKMSLGKTAISEDVARVRAVREAIGPGVKLMTDCNQQFSVPHAIRLGRQLEEFDLSWMEEPVNAHDHAGEAAVAAALDMPVASGENEYVRLGMLEMISKRSADILMPDLQRMGGPTEFIKVAHLAEAMNVPIAPHLFAEMSLPLATALPGAIYVELMPWFGPLYATQIEINSEGLAVAPTGPGWGFSFDPEAVARFSV